MKKWNKKQTAWAIFALSGVVAASASYCFWQPSHSQTRTASAVLDSYLKDDFEIQVGHRNDFDLGTPLSISTRHNPELHSLLTQLRRLEYESIKEYSPPMCGDAIILKPVNRERYTVWVSVFGVFLFPENSDVDDVYYCQYPNVDEWKLYDQATRFFQSLE
ncbi:hypothetical protein [Gimesia panareensis]|uniref:Uncharacterized protein n=1 Tax=Gimesia panareensis TaxID=2527978 RepID=A0A517ZZ79_9PLAN|nr:hypothetical protein [Gimesia panareensis]QDT24842.1 hypothetical protein Enr10x_01340 [Gimesia panareensis]QDU47787.1 hypothetical protein Pan110_00970 [Gimesia panareensis]